MNKNTADDFFAGAGGFDLALEERGWDTLGHEIMPEARQTRADNGLKTAEQGDVRLTKPRRSRFQIAGPPCPAFSRGGKGAGLAVMELILDAIAEMGAGNTPDFAKLDELAGDERVSLVLQPLRLALEVEPEFLLWEQVPKVLPIWHAAEDVLRDRGYLTAVDVLDAADYGAPQHRKRAVLMGRRDGVQPEWPEAVVRHVSMYEALGWGMTHRPSYTVTAGGTYTGGAEPFGKQARDGMRREFDAGRWIGEERYRVTPEEAAILQGFPKDFVFAGKIGKRHMQAGNAVPVHMSRALVGQFPRP